MDKIFTQKSGDELTKSQVMATILIKLDEAFKNPDNNYEDLCNFFESSFGYAIDKRIIYCPKTKLFKVWEEENYN